MRPAVRAAGAVVLGALFAAACRPDPSSFYERTFLCDSDATDSHCGTTSEGAPMACFPAGKLGGNDFCADPCDPAAGGAQNTGDGTICLDSGVRLKACHPSRDVPGDPGPRECGDMLSCYRTDLTADEGVCLTGKLCADSQKDCVSSNRSACASDLLRALYPTAPLVLDHLQCVTVDCMRSGMNCGNGEVCLPSRVPAQSGPADVCVPQCDANLNCPPNYVCYRRISGPLAPNACIPGLIGYKCETDADCMMGRCLEFGDKFRLCSVPCQTENDCAAYDTERDAYTCRPPAPGIAPHCMTANSFGGAPCLKNSDCLDGSTCALYSPYGKTVTGTCLERCKGDNTCAPRGGIPHTCFDFLDPPVCYPGKTGLPCHTNDDCIEGLLCLDQLELTVDDMRVPKRICTIPCVTDQDCRASRQAGVDDNWCDQGVCVLPRPYDQQCDTPTQCQTQRCEPSTRPGEAGSGITRCVPQQMGGL